LKKKIEKLLLNEIPSVPFRCQAPQNPEIKGKCEKYRDAFGVVQGAILVEARKHYILLYDKLGKVNLPNQIALPITIFS
jgi:hypothetical protein